MDNSLDTAIVNMSDDFFESMLNNTSDASQPNNDPVVTTTDEPPTQQVQQIDTTSISPITDDLFNSIESADPDATDDPNTDSDPTASTESVTPVDDNVSILKNITEFFIEKGLWDDFEGKDEFDFNNENFGELLVKQTEKKASDHFTNLIEETGEYGKAIISYIQEGGNPDDIIDLFKEQQSVTSVDLTSDDAKKAYIEQYYTQVAGIKPERAKKIVTDLEMDGELDNELTDVKGHYDNYYKGQRQELERQQQIEKQQRVEAEENFRNSVMSEVSKRTDLNEKERRKLAEAILVRDQQLPDGTPVNKVFTAFAEAQKNLPDYLELVEFLTDRETYKKKLRAEEQNKSAEKNFNFIKRNAATSRKTGSSTTQTQQPTTSFKFY